MLYNRCYIDCWRIFWWLSIKYNILEEKMLWDVVSPHHNVLPTFSSSRTDNKLFDLYFWWAVELTCSSLPDCLPTRGSQPPLFVPRHLRPPGRLRLAEDGLGGVRVPLRPVLQWRRPGEVRPGAEVRGGPQTGSSSHPPARRLQRTELRQQGRWLFVLVGSSGWQLTTTNLRMGQSAVRMEVILFYNLMSFLYGSAWATKT